MTHVDMPIHMHSSTLSTFYTLINALERAELLNSHQGIVE